MKTIIRWFLLGWLVAMPAMASGQVIKKPTVPKKTVPAPTPPKQPKQSKVPAVIRQLVGNMVYVEGGMLDEWKKWNYPPEPLKSFYIGKYEVTQAEWKAVMGNCPSYFKGDKRPMESVSWHDCQVFISKLNKLTGLKFRLPTWWEWAYAAAGGQRSRDYEYAGSDNLDDVAWYYKNSYNRHGYGDPDYGTHDVGLKRPNELGLYDMNGNVWEFCDDEDDDYPNRVILAGGGWSDVEGDIRKTPNGDDSKDFYYDYLGLRLVLEK